MREDLHKYDKVIIHDASNNVDEMYEIVDFSYRSEMVRVENNRTAFWIDDDVPLTITQAKALGIDTDELMDDITPEDSVRTKDDDGGDEEPGVGMKNDFKDGKLRWDLLPLEEIEDIVRLYTAGARKYGPNNWQNLPDGINRYKGALLRHLMEFERGNEIDPETGGYSLAAVAWNAIAMLWISKHKKNNGKAGK